MQPLAEVLQRIPQDQTWSQPQPLLVTAALRLASTGNGSAGAPLAAAGQMLDQIPPDEEVPSRLARAVIRLSPKPVSLQEYHCGLVSTDSWKSGSTYSAQSHIARSYVVYALLVSYA